MENFENQFGSIHPPRRAPSSVRVRCPDCFKQYSVQASEITEAKPRFECLDCKTHFWIAFPEVLEQKEVIGFPVDWINTPGQRAISEQPLPEAPPIESEFALKESNFVEDGDDLEKSKAADVAFELREAPLVKEEVEPAVESQSKPNQEAAEFPCPKCDGLNPGGAKECQHCGVLIEVYKSRQREERFFLQSPPNKGLIEAWERVIAQYEEESVHQKFVQLVFDMDQLAYAIGKYASILEVYPEDELAKRMTHQLEALAVHNCLGQAEGLNAQKPEREALVPSKKAKFSLSFIIMVLSIVVIALGYFVPTLRNLMGIGVSTLFVTLALRYHFKLIR